MNKMCRYDVIIFCASLELLEISAVLHPFVMSQRMFRGVYTVIFKLIYHTQVE